MANGIARYTVTNGLAGCYMPDNVGTYEFRTRRELAKFIREQIEWLDWPANTFAQADLRRVWSYIARRGSSSAHFTGNPHYKKEGDPAAYMFESLQDLCETEGIDPYEWEVFEHWAVSERFGRQLESQGERVDFDFAGMVVWGRTTTGQGIANDSVVLKIAAELMREIV
jgi:hypothetical protein